ncbi:MAG: class I SAM-dependent methyltransferase [Anaerolineae bacterium]|nr:class I SAM-dependent methyltransferase [Anaerolineae bacterium]
MTTEHEAGAGDELGLLRRTHDPHYYLSADSALRNYIRMADEIAATLWSGARVLDWGAGQGQMSFLLQRRGLEVTAYDLERAQRKTAEPLFPEISIEYGTAPIALPYPDAAFDAALSCGVLEHVPYPAASLAEIARVLRPGGYLFIYNLPQRWSWPELTREALRMGDTHRRRFSMQDVRDLLKATGFHIETTRRSNMLPKHLSGLPDDVRSAYQRLASGNIALDRRLSAVPGVNRFAGLLEVIAVRDE